MVGGRVLSVQGRIAVSLLLVGFLASCSSSHGARVSSERSPSPVSITPSTSERSTAREATPNANAPSSPASMSPADSYPGASSSSSAPGSDSAASPMSRYAEAGTYALIVSGSTTTPFGNSAQSPDGSLMVSASTSQGQKAETSTSDGKTTMAILAGSTADELKSLRITNSLFDLTFSPENAIAMPFPAHVGRHWGWVARSQDGGTQASYKASIRSVQHKSVGSTQVEVLEVDAALTLRGSVRLDGTITDFYAAGLRLVVQEDARYQGVARGITFDSTSRWRLRSARPS